MNENRSSPRAPSPSLLRATAQTQLDLTHVELTWIEKRIEHLLRFGRRAEQTILDRRRSISSFTPGSIFGFVRWGANDYGTVISRMDIVRAVEPGAHLQTLPFARPGGEILLRVDGWPKVERVLKAVDAVEALGIDPADAAPEYWRTLHNRIVAEHEASDYKRERHDAWLKRRGVTR